MKQILLKHPDLEDIKSFSAERAEWVLTQDPRWEIVQPRFKEVQANAATSDHGNTIVVEVPEKKGRNSEGKADGRPSEVAQ